MPRRRYCNRFKRNGNIPLSRTVLILESARQRSAKETGESLMQGQRLLDYKKLLELKQCDLIQATGDRDEIRIHKTADEFEEIQLAMNRELAIRNLDRQTALLHDVTAALARIENGRFGTCLLCEEEISEKRLKAVPWAAHCVSCQEHLEQHPRDYGSNEQMQFV